MTDDTEPAATEPTPSVLVRATGIVTAVAARVRSLRFGLRTRILLMFAAGALLLAACFLWPGWLIVFALSTSYTLSLGLIFLAGLFQAFCWTLIASLILSHTEASMRGRVMGLRTGVVLALPVGNFFAGGIADALGPPLALIVYAVGSILVMLVLVEHF